MNDFSEFEYKYLADNIKLTDFLKLVDSLHITKKLDTSSWDQYYVKSEDDFMRFRQSSNSPELTHKVKTKETNNWQRIEVDLPLRREVTEQTVTEFVKLIGYIPNFRIFKSCFIRWTENCNYVYYIVYNEDMKELGRYIEVELNKDKVSKLLTEEDITAGSFNGPISVLNEAAEELRKLGLTPQNRMKKSLYEIYKK